MSIYIPIPDPITPAWLSTLLREAGVLPQGNVIAFETKLNTAKDYWWPKMQCLVETYRDWYCEELLSGSLS